MGPSSTPLGELCNSDGGCSLSSVGCCNCHTCCHHHCCRRSHCETVVTFVFAAVVAFIADIIVAVVLLLSWSLLLFIIVWFGGCCLGSFVDVNRK